MTRGHRSRRFHVRILSAAVVPLAIGMLVVSTASGQEADWTNDLPGEDDDLARESQNPVGNLINLRFENNSNFNTGPQDSYQNVFNIIPVYPANLNDEWNWINRAILPVIHMDDLGQGRGSETGIGDLLYQGYLSPARPGKIIWGVGPSALLPTGADEFSTDRWSVGPTAVLLAMPGDFVLGLLGTQLWSVDGSNDPDVNLFSLQYFINYNLPEGWYLTSTPIISANWDADSDNRWTVPVGGGIGRVFNIGNQAVNARVQSYWNIEKPVGAPEWSAQAQLTFLFPK